MGWRAKAKAEAMLERTLLVVGLPAEIRARLRPCLGSLGPEPKLLHAATVAEALALAQSGSPESENIACVLMHRSTPDFDREHVSSFGRAWDRAPAPVVLVYEDEAAFGGLDSDGSLEVAAGAIREDRLTSSELGFSLRNALELSETKERLASFEAQLSAMKLPDSDSPLMGRDVFRQKLEDSIRSAGSGMTGAMLIGLDGFKVVNRSFGHEFGDEILAMVAGRLRHCVRHADMLARWGGDEFSAVLEQLNRPEDAVFVAQRVLYAFSRPFVHGGHEIFLTPSIGIAIHPAHGEDGRTLLQHADRAVYRTKRMGGNGYQLYSHEMDTDVAERIALEGRLRSALKRHEFSLHYQPQVDARDGRVVGLEALLRWSDRDRGLRSPLEFIPILEQTGLIVSVGEWVIRQACTQARAWQFAGLPDLRVAVNLSAKQFRETSLVDKVGAILAETGLAPEHLQLELTETVLMEDMRYAAAVMKRLKDMGVLLALDDFGTGYSALAVLKQFPVDTLKIDRAFIKDIATQEDDRNICSAIVTLGHDLRLHVLAEGVEDESQVQILDDQGCHLIQGFLYGRPMPAADAWDWLVHHGEGREGPAVASSQLGLGSGPG